MSLEQNIAEPGYSLDLEVLSLLPKFPARALYDDLAADLGVSKEQVVNAVSRLSEHYHLMKNRGRPTKVSIAHSSWVQAQADANAYLSRSAKSAA